MRKSGKTVVWTFFSLHFFLQNLGQGVVGVETKSLKQNEIDNFAKIEICPSSVKKSNELDVPLIFYNCTATKNDKYQMKFLLQLFCT